MKNKWPYDDVILVWGANALNTVNTSGLIKSCRCFNHYSVVVFDASPPKMTATMVQLWGGMPTLVINAKEIINIDHLYDPEKRTIWGLNLPFWSRFVAPIDGFSDFTAFARLLAGTKVVQPAKINDALKFFVNSTATPNVCFGCGEVCDN